jgi:hypothetical protein
MVIARVVAQPFITFTRVSRHCESNRISLILIIWDAASYLLQAPPQRLVMHITAFVQGSQ